MVKSGPIIVIEDDADDQELLAETFRTLNYPYQIIFFSDGYMALEYIEKTEVKPFLILSDVNMPTINGFELRKKIHNNEELNIRCIPYLFFNNGIYFLTTEQIKGAFEKPMPCQRKASSLSPIA